MSDRAQKIKDAIDRLDTGRDDDWTASGLPAHARMKELTGLEDLTAQEFREAHPGVTRETSKGRETGDIPAGLNRSELDKAMELTAPNSDPATNENVGRTDLAPAEGQAHTADQRELLGATLAEREPIERRQPTPAEIAEHITDPVVLIEAAVMAANASDRHRRNGPLHQFLRHYSVDQRNIKEHQARLDARDERHAKAGS